MDSPFKKTWRGRVVYDRAKHLFKWSDVYRIQKTLPPPEEPFNWVAMVLEVMEAVLEFLPMGSAAKWLAELINGLLPKLLDLLQQMIVWSEDPIQWRQRLSGELKAALVVLEEMDKQWWEA